MLEIEAQLYSIFFWKKLLSLTINIEKGGLKYLTKRTEELVKQMKQKISTETIRTNFDANFLKMRTKKFCNTSSSLNLTDYYSPSRQYLLILRLAYPLLLPKQRETDHVSYHQPPIIFHGKFYKTYRQLIHFRAYLT